MSTSSAEMSWASNRCPFAGAFILLVALIHGVLSYRYRNREAARIGGEIAAGRYRRDET